MAFPATKLDIHTEIYYSGAWHDVTADTRSRQDIVISRGRGDEASRADPGSCTLQLNNGTSKINGAVVGRYTPRNPRSDLFALIGRNTRLRVRVGPNNVGLELTGEELPDNTSYASTPDAAALDIVGDLDLRAEITPDSWRPSILQTIAAKYNTGGNQRSWTFRLLTNGTIELAWTTDGTSGTRQVRGSTAAVASDSGRLAVRATLDVDDGAGNHVVTFYTADSIDDLGGGPSEVQLGSTVVTAGTTSIFSSTANLTVGSIQAGGYEFNNEAHFGGLVHGFEVRDGIAGTLVADADFAGLEPGTRPTFTDDAGLTWTLQDEAEIVDRSVRFIGEVVAWPPRWDLSGNDVWVPVVANGLLRRLGQGEAALDSAMRRGNTDQAIVPPVAYWPMEDGSDATSFASGLSGVAPMTAGIIEGFVRDIRPAAYSDFVASQPIPEFSITTAVGPVPWAAPTGELRIFSLLHVPDAGVGGIRQVLNVTTSGTAAEWGIELDSAGSLRMRAWGRNEASILTSGWTAFALNGKNALFGIWLQQVGADIDWQIFVFEEGATVGSVDEGTLAGHTFGSARTVYLGKVGDLAGTAMGHCAVYNQDTNTVIWDAVKNLLVAWSGETAADRFLRLCDEEGVAHRIVGDPAESVAVGAQKPETFLDLLYDAADAELAIFDERRDALALRWRNHAELENQTGLALYYNERHVSPPFEPLPDDQATANDVTVERVDGSSARAVKLSGPMNVSETVDDPLGVDRYPDKVTLNLATDDQLEDQAWWRLHLGTVDEDRIPQLGIDLARNPALIDQVLALDTGDRITIANPPEWMAAQAIDLIIQGYEERLRQKKHYFVFNCSPGSAWRTWLLEDDEQGRADTILSATTHQFAAGTDTAMDVRTLQGPRWETDAGEFPFDVTAAGVQLRVTAIDDSATDTFNRTVSNGFGTADTGQAWTTSGGAASDYSVTP